MDHSYFKSVNKKPINKRYCSVPQCNNRAWQGISFHKFPEDAVLRDKWSAALKIGKKISRAMVVCSEHFKSEDFFYFGAHSTRKNLKKSCIPSCKLPKGSHDKVLTGQQLTNRTKRTERSMKRSEAVTPLLPCTNHPEDSTAEEEPDVLAAEACVLAAEAEPEVLAAEALLELQEAVVQDLGANNIVFQNAPSQVHPPNEPRKCTLLNMVKTDSDLNAFTGLRSLALLNGISQAAELLLVQDEGSKLQLDVTERIVLTLVKLKLNISFTCISILFGVSITTCIRYFHLTLRLLSKLLSNAIQWPAKEDIVRNMPRCFDKFRDTRVVLDCTETPVEKPSCLACRLCTYSHYKGTHTIKFLIGVAPEGLITFVSQAYGGRASDKAIYLQSDLMSRFIPHQDAVMSDKGFLVEHECTINGVKLIRPPFLGKNKQFSKEKGQETAEIAQARVHVERAIQRLKIFKILKGQLAWNLVSCANDIMTVAAGIVNLSPPILAIDKF